MKITLKDNVVAEVAKGTTVESVINSISESLAKNAICGKVNGALVDLSAEIGKNCKLEIITMKDKDAIKVLWHSSSHILAQAVKTVFPTAKLVQGASDEDGFYYDFDLRRKLSQDDLTAIEDEMQRIISSNFPVVKATLTKEQALALAEEKEESYKIEELNKLKPSESVGIVTQGDFFDFCEGPHIKSTGLIRAFKITGANTSSFGDGAEKKIFTRINGVSFFYKKDLEAHLKNQELIAKRNHLVIGQKKGLFARDNSINRIIFLNQGQRVFNNILDFLSSLADEYEYSEVSLPSIDNKNGGLVEAIAYKESDKKSGVFPIKYFVKERIEPKTVNLDNGLINYLVNTRDKFVTFSRFGELDTQLKELFAMVKKFYSAFGFDVSARLYVGAEAIPADYSKVKGIIKRAIEKNFKSVDQAQSDYYKLDVLKVEYVITDSMNREWSMGSLHVDFGYAPNNGIALSVDRKLEFPITIVNNICKSIERLMAILVENTEGEMPFWLSPITVKLVATDAKAVQKTKKIAQSLLKYKIYSELYLAHKGKVKPDPNIPLTLAIGAKELSDGVVRVISKAGAEVCVTARKFIQTVFKSKYNRSYVVPNL